MSTLDEYDKSDDVMSRLEFVLEMERLEAESIEVQKKSLLYEAKSEALGFLQTTYDRRGLLYIVSEEFNSEVHEMFDESEERKRYS